MIVRSLHAIIGRSRRGLPHGRHGDTIRIVLPDFNSRGFALAHHLAQAEDQLDAVSKDKLIEDLKVVAQDVEELLKATANQTGDKIAAARARAAESLRSAQMRLAGASEEIAVRARQAAAATDEYVHEKPWQAIGVAAGVSFLIGYLIGRR